MRRSTAETLTPPLFGTNGDQLRARFQLSMPSIQLPELDNRGLLVLNGIEGPCPGGLRIASSLPQLRLMKLPNHVNSCRN